MKLPLPNPDKLAHFFYGTVAGTVGIIAGALSGLPYAATVMGLVGPVLVGFGKEAYDRASGRGHPSVPDALWTSAAGIPLALGTLL